MRLPQVLLAVTVVTVGLAVPVLPEYLLNVGVEKWSHRKKREREKDGKEDVERERK